AATRQVNLGGSIARLGAARLQPGGSANPAAHENPCVPRQTATPHPPIIRSMRFAILLFAAALSLSAQQGAQKSAASLYISDAAAIKAGEESYKLVCSGCHGIT